MTDKDHKRVVAKRTRRKWREVIYARDGYRCAYCGKVLPSHRLSVDHFWPSWLGGKQDAANMVTACIPCNKLKSNLPPLFFRKHRRALAKALQDEAELFRRLQHENHQATNRGDSGRDVCGGLRGDREGTESLPKLAPVAVETRLAGDCQMAPSTTQPTIQEDNR